MNCHLFPLCRWPMMPVARRGGQATMKDYQVQLEKLRRDAAECKLISELATDKQKRALFDRLAAHLGTLADQVEQEMLSRKDAG
jgi:ribosomal protein S7